MNMILKTFEQTGIGKLRTVIIEGEPWFLGADVGACLGYANPRRAYLDHTEEKYRKALFYKDSPDSGLYKLWSEKGFREKIIISEAGLFQMIFESRTELAATFRDWVYEEVLPSIRKNGGYIAGQEDLDPSDRLKLNETIKALSADVSRLQKRRHEILAENRELKEKLYTLKKELKANKEDAELWLSMYESLEKDLDEIIRKTKPVPEKKEDVNPRPVVVTTVDGFIIPDFLR